MALAGLVKSEKACGAVMAHCKVATHANLQNLLAAILKDPKRPGKLFLNRHLRRSESAKV